MVRLRGEERERVSREILPGAVRHTALILLQPSRIVSGGRV